ncbi:MAG: DUF5058 family protein [Christensenellales bacterium]|jgi:hypothetical protein|nr:DUF5058 family protein [Clostridiales bacterium]
MKEYNFPLVFALGAVIAATIIVMSVVFLLKAIKRGKQIGMTNEQFKKAITTSAVFSIVPSIPIVIGVGIMMQFLGLAIPWIRLTVIGALQYEISAVFAVSDGAAELTAGMLVSATLVMTISIISGPLFNAIFYKKYQGKLMEMQVKNKPKMDAITGSLLSGMLAGIISAILIGGFFTLNNTEPDSSGIVTNGAVTLITLAVSMGIIAICGVIMKVFKQKWLENYALPLSILGAMLVAFFVHPIFVPAA